MRYLILLTLSAVSLLHWGCSRDSLDTKDNAVERALQEAAEAVEAAELDIQNVESRSGNTVTVLAGSVDALAGAIADAGFNGTVILESGMHQESATVLITQKVSIVGQPGAVLTVGVGAPNPTPPFFVDPALHVQGADGVHIEGLEIRPSGATGHTGILLQNAPRTRISGNALYDFQLGIVLADADHARIYDNTLGGYDPTFSVVTWGIVSIDGRLVTLRGNHINTYGAAIFTSDKNGRAYQNVTNDNLIGFLICTVGPIVFLPDGSLAQAPEPCNRWMITGNSASGNVWGYLVIDGAFNNRLIQNEASGNFLDQIELAGVSDRFGAPMPTSHNNLVVSTREYSDVSIKDCGEDNTVIGGVPVDTNESPCI